MHLNFHPQRRDGTLQVQKSGDILTINGDAFDFSPLPNGQRLPSEAIASDFCLGASREGGILTIDLLLPHGANPAPAVAFPAALDEVPDGVVNTPSSEVSL